MSDIIIQPFSFYIGSMIAGLFTGFSLAVGNTIVKIWFEPKFEKFKKDKLHKKLFVRKKMNSKTKKNIQILIIVALIVLGLIFVVHAVDEKKYEAEQKVFEEFKSYCVSPYINAYGNPLTNSDKYCNDKFNELFGVRT